MSRCAFVFRIPQPGAIGIGKPFDIRSDSLGRHERNCARPQGVTP